MPVTDGLVSDKVANTAKTGAALVALDQRVIVRLVGCQAEMRGRNQDKLAAFVKILDT